MGGISGDGRLSGTVYIPVREVNFRAHDHTGDILLGAEVLDLIVDDLDGLKRLDGGDGIYEDEAMDGGCMFGWKDRRLIL